MHTQTTPLETAPSPAAAPRTAPRGQALVWLPVLLVLALVPVLYGHIALDLVQDWTDLPDFSHGFLIPFFVLFLLWDRRHTLRRTPLQPTWAGLPLVLFALLLLVGGVFGSDRFIARISFILFAAGLTWMLAGRAMLAQVKLPLGVMLLAMPIPALVFNQITFPLQILASKMAAALLPLAGVPVLREGNIIQLPAMQLEVAEACSGIRSLLSLFTVAVIYGYFLERTTARRALLALASLPIAVAANVVRIVGTGLCVQYWNPDKAVGFFHEFSGWLMFLVSLACLYLVHTTFALLAPEPALKPTL
jgi:exosortase